MKQDSETKKKLLACARAEFMEKGYMNASLRSICKKAGVTTGALYFFFENKEALFNALTEDAIRSLYQIMLNHYKAEGILEEEELLRIKPETGFKEDLEVAELLIHQMYARREDILLALTKSQGTKYENVLDAFVELTQKHFQMMAEKMQRAYGGTGISNTLINWICHLQIDAFVYMITHIEKEEEALVYMKKTVNFMIHGWYSMFQES